MTKRDLRLVRNPTIVENLANALTGKGWNSGLDGKVGRNRYNISGAMHDGAIVGVITGRDGYVDAQTHNSLVDAAISYSNSGEGRTVVHIGKGLKVNASRLEGDAWVNSNWSKISKGYEGIRLVETGPQTYEVKRTTPKFSERSLSRISPSANSAKPYIQTSLREAA